jgi:hypothetical protein
MKSILYSDHIIIDKQKDFNKMIYIEPKISKKNIKYILLKFKNDTTLIEASIDKMTLLPLIFSVLDPNHDNINLWAKIQHHINELSDHPDVDIYLKNLGKVTLLDGFIYGFVTYISFFYLIEKYEFKSLLPINFQLPANLSDGDCTDYHVLQYMYQPLSAMMDIFDEDYFLHSYFKIIIGFITIWSCVFHAGPGINENIINTLNSNVMTGVTKYYLYQLKNIKKCRLDYVDSTSYISSESNTKNTSESDIIYQSSTNSNTTDNINDKIYYNASFRYYSDLSSTKSDNNTDDKNYYNSSFDLSSNLSTESEYIEPKKLDLSFYDSNNLTFQKNKNIENIEDLIEKKVNKKINKIIDNLGTIITNHDDKSLDDKITRMINDKFNLYLNDKIEQMINDKYLYINNTIHTSNNVYNLDKPLLNLTTGLQY